MTNTYLYGKKNKRSILYKFNIKKAEKEFEISINKFGYSFF